LILPVELVVFLDSDAQSERVAQGHRVDAAYPLLVLAHGPHSAVHAYLALHVLEGVVQPLAVDGLSLVPEPESVILLDEVLAVGLRIDQVLAQLATYLLVLLRELLDDSLLGLDLALELRFLISETDRDFLQLVHLRLCVRQLLGKLLLRLL